MTLKRQEQSSKQVRSNTAKRFQLLATVGTLCALLATNGCMAKSKTFSDKDSDAEAISAVSKNMFGTNVRGYMWALTTANPKDVKPPAPANAGTNNFFGAILQIPGQIGAVFSGANQGANAADGNKADDIVKNYYQCWYYAETPFYVKLDGPELKRLFMDKSHTQNVNFKFVDIQNLYGEQQKNANLRRLISFGASALQVGLCGATALLAKEGSANFRKNSVLFPAICGMALVSINTAITQFSGGDATWGSDKAKEEIEKQVRSRVDQLEEINWDALTAIKNSAKSFNTPDKAKLNTQYNCPSNESWVADLMTDESAPTPTPTATALH